MQNDLICRSAVIDRYYAEYEKQGICDGDEDRDWLKKCIEEATAVDAVEVVRCKDCKHWNEDTGWCYHHSHFVTPDGEACHPWESADWKMLDENDFCNYGERRKDKC